MVQYETMESAKEALNGMKGTFLVGGKRILVGFLSLASPMFLFMDIMLFSPNNLRLYF